VLDGCEYREAMQAVQVSGGVAGNVVPDRVQLTVNHRFAPDRRRRPRPRPTVAACWLPEPEPGDGSSRGRGARRPPGSPTRCCAPSSDRNGLPVRAKLGWTDVARFAAAGIPACNVGPGDATIAHTRDEFVTRASLERVYLALHELVQRGP
jgi:succinyl-diaminopimelate desuccinylase